MYDHALHLETLADMTGRLLVPDEVEAVFDELSDQVTDLFELVGGRVTGRGSLLPRVRISPTGRQRISPRS